MKIGRGDAPPEEPLGWELAPGAEVAGFVIEGRLAAGSFGALYQARRGGRRFAIKLVLRDARGEREVDALRRVQALPVVGFHGYGLWPEHQPRFLVLALELVEGDALDEWARSDNPSPRALLERVMRPLVSTLGSIHAAGVVHRDVKEANIVMRREDGQPVLVDFGAAGYEGAPRLTLRLPPGTPEYRSPEVLRFAREWGGEPPPGRPGDDLWALGVTFYALLTRTLPFGDRHGPLVNSILEDTPEPPHARNPRVPPPVGALCLRMLAKAPGERHADADALARELEDLLAGADAAWEVPLFSEEHAEYPPPAPVPEPVAPPAPRSPSGRGRWLGALALGTVTATFLAVGDERQSQETDREIPPFESSFPLLTLQDEFGHELAPGHMTGEVVFVAGPQKSPTLAPVAHAMNPPEPSMSFFPKNGLLTSTLAATAALCTTPACTSAPKVRPPRLMAPAPCPEGSQKTHEMMGLHPRNIEETRFPHFRVDEIGNLPPIPVRAGPMSLELYAGSWKGVPQGTLFRGQLYVQDKRVYGRFTKMIISGEKPMPVCMMMIDPIGDIGLASHGGTPDRPVVYSTPELLVVEEFDEANALSKYIRRTIYQIKR